MGERKKQKKISSSSEPEKKLKRAKSVRKSKNDTICSFCCNNHKQSQFKEATHKEAKQYSVSQKIEDRLRMLKESV